MIEDWKVHALWAKKPKDDEPDAVVSLPTHLEETAEVAEELWEKWLPTALKSQLNKSLFIFLAYAHDLGKVSPVFLRDMRGKASENMPRTRGGDPVRIEIY